MSLRFVVPVALCGVACGRIGYAERDEPLGATSGGGGSLVSVSTTSGGSGGTGGASAMGGGAGSSATAGGGGNAGSSGASGGGGNSGEVGDSSVSGCTESVFNFHRYLLCTSYLTHPDAAAQCAANGMQLAKVENAAENQWIVDTLAGPILPVDSGVNWIWLGGSDASTEDSWLWPDGTLFYQNGPVGGLYANWGQAEPNDARTGEDCLAVRISYRWTDLDCAEVHHFCCEQYP